MSAVSKVLDRVIGLKQHGTGRWMARCPAHDDRSPSLSIRETDDGRVLLHCFGGCEVGDVVEKIGLHLADLFDRPLSHHMAPIRRAFDPMQALIAVAHEMTVVSLIASDMAEAGRGDCERQQRLIIAVQRLNTALSMVGDLPVPEEIKRIRRAEARP